jgi:F-type H+-transporting ATPase subunit delta
MAGDGKSGRNLKLGILLRIRGRDSLARGLILRRFKAHGNWRERGGAESREPDLIYINQSLNKELGSRSGVSCPRLRRMNVASEKAQETGLAGRYATAVFELAQEAKAVDAVAADFTALRNAIHASPDLARLVRSPAFSREDQQKALGAILAKMQVSPLTQKFVALLAAKRRLFALEGIIAAYNHKVARLKGEVEAEVTSARPLSHGEAEELKRVLKSTLGREPRLQTRVDNALLGGLVVKLGSRMIDTSIRTKLNGLRVAMKGN